MAEPGNGRPPDVRLALVESKVESVGDKVDDLGEKMDQMSSRLWAILAAVTTSAIGLAIHAALTALARGGR